MTLIHALRRRWWVRGGILGMTLLATAAYVAFDVLDLDGSDLQIPDLKARGAVWAAHPPLEAALQRTPSSPEPLSPAPAALPRQDLAQDRQVTSSQPAADAAPRRAPALPRGKLRQKDGPVTPSSGDPA